MTLLVGKHTRAIVQGITGNQGAFHTRLMLDYGTQIVAGVTPGKGATVSQGVPVFDTVASALEKIDANATIIFVPAPFAKEAGMEAIDAGLNPVVIITEMITGLNFVDVLKMFRDDKSTDAVVLIGEIGGSAEEDAANYIAETHYPKPVAAYVAGRAAPPGKRMGHAGAIITGTEGTADAKMKRFSEVGVLVAEVPSELPRLLQQQKAALVQH